ncbi:hypothetical protein COOONC_20558 [Cooperia oncophora]
MGGGKLHPAGGGGERQVYGSGPPSSMPSSTHCQKTTYAAPPSKPIESSFKGGGYHASRRCHHQEATSRLNLNLTTHLHPLPLHLCLCLCLCLVLLHHHLEEEATVEVHLQLAHHLEDTRKRHQRVT